MDPHEQITAIVPLKALAAAKQRLAAALDASTRRDLVAWMFSRVVAACHAAPRLTRLLVVAGDDEAAALAIHHGAEAFVEPAGGLSGAIRAADTRLGCSADSLVVVADLPLLTAEDLDAVCTAAAPGPSVTVAPTVDGGTGALLRRPGTVIQPAFGPQSAARHLGAGRTAGASTAVVERGGFALDVDDEADLRIAEARIPDLGGLRPHVPNGRVV